MHTSDEAPRGARDGDFELVTLRNGTRAVRHRGHGEVMHPSVGPWLEACALYVEQSRLAERLQAAGPPLRVWDVGLGAGTNAVAALTCARELGARQRRKLEVVSFENDSRAPAFGIGRREWFPFLQPFAAAGRALLDGQGWSEEQSHWRLHLGDAAARWQREEEPAELIFFDPFSPASNPPLWTPAAFARLRAQARDDERGCTLFTYSAATPTRVSLLLGGFYVGTGVATGMKKETTVAATRRELLEQPLDARWLARWERSAAQAPHGSTAARDEIRRALKEHPQF